MQTSVTRLLGIEQPIVQAPIGGLSNPRLAAAVSNAGGLGMIAMTWTEPDDIRQGIRSTQALTSSPFGINLIIDEDRSEHAAHRVLRNSTIDAWEAAGRPASGARPGEGKVLAHRSDGSEILRYESVSVRVGATGNIADLSLWAGQGVGLIHEVLPAAQIVHRTVNDAERILRRLGAQADSEAVRT